MKIGGTYKKDYCMYGIIPTKYGRKKATLQYHTVPQFWDPEIPIEMIPRGLGLRPSTHQKWQMLGMYVKWSGGEITRFYTGS